MVPWVGSSPFEYSRTAEDQKGRVGEALRYVLDETKGTIYHLYVRITRM